MNKRRLLKLADMLDENAANKKGMKFDFWTVGKANNAKPGLDCGTKGCGMGLAAVSGAFRRAGLGYGADDEGYIHLTWSGLPVGFASAAMYLFDISTDQSLFLFAKGGAGKGMKGSRGERALAKQIRQFVAGEVGPSNDSA